MGNSSLNGEESTNMENVDVISKYAYEGLGTFKIGRESNSGMVFLLFESNYHITNKGLIEADLQQLKKINQIKHSCSLYRFNITESNNLCFENLSLNLIFEHYNTSMEELIEKSNTFTAEKKVWLIIKDILTYLIELYNMGYEHGDLQPKNILFNNNEVVKIACPLLYTTYQRAYEFRIANETYKSTFSPEHLEGFEYRIQNPKLDQEKADVFSLGICLLSLCSKESFTYFYDFSNNTILFDRLKISMADMVKNGYSERLFYFINQCLKENISERTNLQGLYKLSQTKKDVKSVNHFH